MKNIACTKVIVPEELREDLQIQKAIANRGKVCQCGTMKEISHTKKGQKTNKNKVKIGGKRKMRCKKCVGCLASKCNKCVFCLNASMKKTCELRQCLFPVVPNCPCFS